MFDFNNFSEPSLSTFIDLSTETNDVTDHAFEDREAIIIRVWPCNTWLVLEDEPNGYPHMSDDYVDININHRHQFSRLDQELQNEIIAALYS